MAFSFIASATGSAGSAGATSATTGAITTTGARVLVASAAWFTDGSTTATLTDSRGNVWTAISSLSNAEQRLQSWFCLEPSVGASHTVTLTLSASANYASLMVVAYGGQAAAYQGMVSATGSGTSLASGSITPGAAGSLFVAALSCAPAAGASATNDAGLTALGVDYALAARVGAAMPHGIVAGTSPVTVTHSYSPTAPNAIAQTLVFTSVDVAAPDDSAVFASPYNHRISAGTYDQTNAPGAYVKFRFAGPSLSMLIDSTIWTGLTGTTTPAISYAIDSTYTGRRTLAPGEVAVVLAGGLSTGTHTAEVHLIGAWWQADRWTSPVSALRITGYWLSPGYSLSAPASTRPNRLLVYGDSIAEGYEADAAGVSVLGQNASRAWPALLAEALNAEYGTVGYAGQGYLATGGGNVPTLRNAWSLLQSGQSRLVGGLLDPEPDYIVIAHGTNDGASSDGSITTAVAAQIADLRAAAPDAWILVVPSPWLTKAAAVQAGVTAAADAKCRYIDTATDFSAYPGLYVSPHLTGAGHARFGALVSKLIGDALAATLALDPLGAIVS